MPAIKTKDTTGTARGVKLLNCVCNHPAQDELHGHKRRVMNPCKGGKMYRCTVCSREREG